MAYDRRDEFFDAGVGGDWSQGDDVADDAMEGERSRWRLSRLSKVIIAGLTLAAVVVLAGGVHAQERGRRTAEAAVLAYVDLIKAGDVEAATALVPVLADRNVEELENPQGQRGLRDELTGEMPAEVDQEEMLRVLDPALLTNAAYAVANRVSDVSVEADRPSAEVAVGATTEVTVNYVLGGSSAGSVLRVERLPDSFPFLPRWKVVDSLAVPTIVRVTDPLMGTPTLGEVAVTGSGNVNAGFPQYATMVYPGEYVLDFDGGYWFSAPSTQLRVASSPQAPSPDSAIPVIASMFVKPSGAALDAALGKAGEFLDQCASRGPDIDLASCPALYEREPETIAERAAEIQLTTSEAMAVVNGVDQDARPAIAVTVNGTIAAGQGEMAGERFALQVFIESHEESSKIDVFALPGE